MLYTTSALPPTGPRPPLALRHPRRRIHRYTLQRRVYDVGASNLTRICRSSMKSKTYTHEETDQISVIPFNRGQISACFLSIPGMMKGRYITPGYIAYPFQSRTSQDNPATKTLQFARSNNPKLDRAFQRSA